MGGHRKGRGERPRLGAQRVDAQRRLGRLVVSRHQRARPVRAERVEPQLRDPLGVGVAQRRLARRDVRQPGHDRRRLARGAPQHRVDELRAAGRLGLGERDGLADRRMRRDPVQVGELVEPEPQRRDHHGVQLRDGALGERLDQEVERGAALDGAIRQPGGQRALARVKMQATGLGVQRPVRPRVVLEDPPQHRERTDAGGGHISTLGLSFVPLAPIHDLSDKRETSKGRPAASNNRPDGLKDPSGRSRTCRWAGWIGEEH
jgi:hypothetical protein